MKNHRIPDEKPGILYPPASSVHTPGFTGFKIKRRIQVLGSALFNKSKMMLIKKKIKSVYPVLMFIFLGQPSVMQAFTSLPKTAFPASYYEGISLVVNDSVMADILAGRENLNPEFPLYPGIYDFVMTYQDQHSRLFDKMKMSKQYYLQMIDKIFGRQKLPVELKYLAVVESKLKNNAVSSTGAAGIWQFMPSTGELFGLNISDEGDDRMNAWKSSVAAARYLKYLYRIYHDWLLVVAAYNSGPGTVNRAIRKSGSRNFWELQEFLPRETRLHVKKFIATHYYFEGSGSAVTTGKYDIEKSETQNLPAITGEQGQEDESKEKTPERKLHPKPITLFYQDDQWSLTLKK